MDLTNSGSRIRDLEKYKSLATSLGIAKASSFAKTPNMLSISNMLKDNESLLKAIERNSVFGNQSRLYDDVLKSYASAINPFKNNKSHLLTLSEQIGKSLGVLTDSLEIAKASTFASTAKMLGINSMIKDNESLLKAINKNNVFGSQIKSIQSMARSYEAAIKPFSYDKSHLLSQSKEIQKSIDSMLKPLGLSNMHSVTSAAKMLGLRSMVKSNQSFLKALDRNSTWGNQLKHVDLQSQLTNLISTSNNNLLEKMMISMQSQPVAVLNTDYVPSAIELATATEILYEETDQQSFIERFNKLPAYLQAFILYIVMSFLIPITNNIAANLLTPIVQEAIEDLYRNDTDKIRIIKKSPSKITHTKIDTSHLRFIAAKNGLHVRSSPSSRKSKIKDTIHLGKLVEVLEKRKNWIKVSYKKEDKIIKGWVFTRYTKRFDP